MRLVFGLTTIVACLVGGGTLAYNGLGLDSSLDMDTSFWKPKTAEVKQTAPTPKREMLSDDELRARFLTATSIPQSAPVVKRIAPKLAPLPSVSGEIRVPDNSRARRSSSSDSTSRTGRASSSAVDRAPYQAYDLNRRTPVSRALSQRYYRSSGFKYTAEGRRGIHNRR